MIFREYNKNDELGWVRCRLLSFLDSSYYDDVKREKETYENPSICMVAESDGKIIGFIDVEYELDAGEVCYLKGEKGAVIWHLGVLPEFRNQKVASKLYDIVESRLADKGIKRIEVWTQDDAAANGWYAGKGFIQKGAYLNAYVKGNSEDEVIKKYINLKNTGNIYGIRNFNFEAPIERKRELLNICYRLHEVRVYEKVL